jgi:excisionase family DNA binding protein
MSLIVRDEELVQDVLTIDQTARLLQVSRQTVYKLINEGDIPCRRVGERWRFSKKALLDWIAKGQ